MADLQSLQDLVSTSSENAILANRMGDCPAISTAGHTGIPVGTDASAAFTMGDSGWSSTGCATATARAAGTTSGCVK